MRNTPTITPPIILRRANLVGSKAVARIRLVILSVGEETIKASTGPKEAPFQYKAKPTGAIQQEQKGCANDTVVPVR